MQMRGLAMNLFDPVDWPDVERPSAVLRHELGHAFVWYHHGGAIGTFRLFPYNGKIGGVVRASGHSGFQETDDGWDEAEAERTLAGEIAARQHCGLRAGISVGRGASKWRVTTAFDDALRDVAQWQITIHSGEPDGVADIMKVMVRAEDEHSHDWAAWIAHRHLNAQRIVVENFDRIEAVARSIESTGRLQTAKGIQLAGFELLNAIRDTEMPMQGARKPVELRTRKDNDPISTRFRRWWNRRRADAWPVQRG